MDRQGPNAVQEADTDHHQSQPGRLNLPYAERTTALRGEVRERGVPSLRQEWIEMHYGKPNEQFNPAAVNLTGAA